METNHNQNMKSLWRNISMVSALFVVVFAVLLAINYFQYTKASPLNTPALVTLKEQLDADPENQLLQQQIREFDLLARKVYFTGKEQVAIGVYILLGASLLLMVSLRLLYASYKRLPEKEMDPLDEWAIKTMSRRYVMYGGIGLIVIALTVAFVSQYSMESSKIEDATAEVTPAEGTDSPEGNPADNAGELVADTLTVAGDTTALSTDSVAEVPVSKVTHSAFRGNNGLSASAAKDIPTSFDLAGGKNILWKKKVERQGYNSPVIIGNKVFFTGADKDVRELFCYDLTNGELLWRVKADKIPGSPSAVPKTTDDTGLAASTVAANTDVVCAIFATGDIIAADHSGKRLWAKNIGVPDNHYGYSSSLLIYNGLLLVQYDQNKGGKVCAFDAKTGAERWSKARTADKISWASPIIARSGNRTELILMGTPHITSYNPQNGEEYWKVKCFSGEVGSSPAYADGIVFGASEYATLVAVNAEDGTVLWENNDFLPEISSAAATKTCVFIATSYGTLVCRDAKTGEENKVHELNDAFYASPMIVGGKLYLFNTSGKLYIFTANKECTLINTVSTGEKTYATPAFTDGKMVVRSNNSIYCVATVK